MQEQWKVAENQVVIKYHTKGSLLNKEHIRQTKKQTRHILKHTLHYRTITGSLLQNPRVSDHTWGPKWGLQKQSPGACTAFSQSLSYIYPIILKSKLHIMLKTRQLQTRQKHKTEPQFHTQTADQHFRQLDWSSTQALRNNGVLSIVTDVERKASRCFPVCFIPL